MADYYVIPTNIGEAKMANALALGIPLAITELALGDGEGDGARGTPIPNPEATALVSERRRAPLNSFSVDPENSNVLVAEQVIPETAGGWWIREMGLFDEDGDLIFVCNTPPTYKPQLSEGSGRTQVVRMASIVSDTSAVTLKVDPSVVLATREYADSLVVGLREELKPEINSRVIQVGSVAELDAIESPQDGWQASVLGVTFEYKGGSWFPAQGYVSSLCFAGADGGARIQAALDYAENLGKNTVVVVPSNGPDASNRWLLNNRIMLPSNTFLMLDGCHLYLNDDVNTNIFRTKGADEDPLGSNQHIYILGQNNPILEGNATNQPGLPSDNTGDVNRLGIVFFNTQNFGMSGFTVRETHGWGISCENGCSDGDIGPIHFEQTGSTPNQDGVNLRQGCHDIIIHDITGTTGDDSVALTAVGNSAPAIDGMQITYDDVAGVDIYNVTIRNVTTRLKGAHHTLRLLNSDGRELHDITIENINDITLPSDILTAAKAINAVITINGGTYFDLTEVQENEMRNLDIRNVSGNANSIILFGNECGRINIDGVAGRGYCKGLLRFDKSSAGSPTMKEISVRGLSYLPRVDAADFDWDDSGTVYYVGRASLQNVQIEGTYVLLCTRFFQSTADATLNLCQIRQSKLTLSGREPFLTDASSNFFSCVLQDFELGNRLKIGEATGATSGLFYNSPFRFVLKGDCPDVTSVDTAPNPYKASRVIFEAGVGGFTDATYAMGDSVNWVPIVALPNY